MEESVLIAGVGLIGGSIAAALKRRSAARQIIGVGRDLNRLNEARRRGLIDVASDNLAAAAREATFIVICTPVDRIVADVRQAATAARPGTLITDAGSVKRVICDPLRGELPEGIEFIGSHPLAGSERQGFEHSDPELYAGRVCVVTPQTETPRHVVERAARFWQVLGARVMTLSPAEHDRALATTSHLPHLTAAALASLLETGDRPFAATGFRDTTRVASGDPDLWTAICLANAAEITAALTRYRGRVEALIAAIEQGDAARIRQLLEEGRQAREGLFS